MKFNAKWPVLKSYYGDYLQRVAMPIGGIGTGTVSLAGNGGLRDWEVANRPAKRFAPIANNFNVSSFFAVYARPEGGEAVARALEGPVAPLYFEGSHGSLALNHGLPRFREAVFGAAYPLGQVLLSDDTLPVEARLEAFNPLIPGDADRSGMPGAVLRYVIRNRTAKPMRVSVLGMVPNFIGQDGSTPGKTWMQEENFRSGQIKNRNRIRETPGLRGLFMDSEGVDPKSTAWGTLALATTAPGEVTYRTDWKKTGWYEGMLEFWDDFSEDGRLEQPDGCSSDSPIAALSVAMDLAPRETRAITFILGWHFPNRLTWSGIKDEDLASVAAAVAAAAEADCTTECGSLASCGTTEGEPVARPFADPRNIGNYYCGQYADAWDAAAKLAKDLVPLERDTLLFVKSLCDSPLPEEVIEAALCNLVSLRTQTCFRTPDGRLFGWEGTGDRLGSCHGSCTHVWNYEQTVAFLFGDLARSMRDVEFGFATREDGLMSFRVDLPLVLAKRYNLGAADGQLGCIMKLYRDWQLSGDDAMLRRLWPMCRKSLEFCWLPGSWDADQDGVMEGCQHNTMDVEYFGPNPQMQGWYLGALRASEEMARYLGEEAFAETCMQFYTAGARWMDQNLFNGEYYEHQIWPIPDSSTILKGLLIGMGSGDMADPSWQLGAGCLVDQLVGQYMAHVCGLGHLVDRENIKTTLRSILKYNHLNEFHGHFNALRSFVLAHESALLMASYPLGRRPSSPFPYFTEVMTGFEYTAAIGMLYEGLEDEGLKVIRDIRARYDGKHRNPFDEAECGHNYARAMAAWGAVLALSGFHYSAVKGAMTFRVLPGTTFWSTGDAWGVCTQTKDGRAVKVKLRVHVGTIALERFSLTGLGDLRLPGARRLKAGQTLSLRIG